MRWVDSISAVVAALLPSLVRPARWLSIAHRVPAIRKGAASDRGAASHADRSALKLPIERVQRLALGGEPRRRLRVKRTLTAAAVYGSAIVTEWMAVWDGRVEATVALAFSVWLALGVGYFYIAIRSGGSERAADPALTMPQMIFALLSLALAYWINAHVRGTLLMLVALVLVFGAFILPPRRCRQLGGLSVALIACAMAAGALQDPARFEPRLELINFSLALLALPAIGFLAGDLSSSRIDQRRQKRELQTAVERLQGLATHDELTGLVNRRHVLDWVARKATRGRSGDGAICLALIDLDHFKRINDTLGHPRGDEVLRIFAREATALLRTDDLLARWGGEEFLLVMPATDVEQAQAVLHRLRLRMAEPSLWADCPASRVTFSAGITTLNPGHSLEAALRQADSTLYQAKNAGRDRFVAG